MELDLKHYGKLLVVFLILLFSCSKKGEVIKVFLRKNVDISFIRKVAVLRFENHTKNKFAGERIRDVVSNELLALGLFDVVDKSVVDLVLNEEVGEESYSLDRVVIRRIAKRLGVQALILGSVDEYKYENKGGFFYPVVAVSLRLIDGRSGEIIWSISATKTGYNYLGRLLGIKSKDLMELSFDLVESMLKRLK